MMESELNGSWRQKTLLAGGLIGALTGLGVAFLLIKRAENEERAVSISAGEGVRLGLLLLGLLRSVTELGEKS